MNFTDFGFHRLWNYKPVFKKKVNKFLYNILQEFIFIIHNHKVGEEELWKRGRRLPQHPNKTKHSDVCKKLWTWQQILLVANQLRIYTNIITTLEVWEQLLFGGNIRNIFKRKWTSFFNQDHDHLMTWSPIWQHLQFGSY